MSALPFETFTARAKNAPLYPVRPYGIYHKGVVYWDEELPRKKGSLVRYFEDSSTPVLSLCVFSADGAFLCSAWPVQWVEDDTDFQHEMAAAWALMSNEEIRNLMEGAE